LALALKGKERARRRTDAKKLCGLEKKLPRDYLKEGLVKIALLSANEKKIRDGSWPATRLLEKKQPRAVRRKGEFGTRGKGFEE